MATSSNAFAWGKRGHALVAEASAYVLSNQEDGKFLKASAYALGYYANVPDIVWKNSGDKIKAIESPQHYMDLEGFEKIEDKDWQDKKTVDRVYFFDRFKIPNQMGRAYWRIIEMFDGLKAVTTDLRNKKKLDFEKKQNLQGRWLVQAGLMAHYVGDLGQPLHTTENFDGQKLNQMGVHSFFEERAVEELYPELAKELNDNVSAQWSHFHKENSDKTVGQVILQLTRESHKYINEIFEIDKKEGRKEPAKVAQKYKKLILEGLTRGSLALAELWSRNLGWQFDAEKFYLFEPTPEYRYPTDHKRDDLE